jgi:Fe-S-cluster containining protein
MNQLELLSRMSDLHADIERDVAVFQVKSGLRCPAGCGQCCLAAEVQVTVLEMLPMARQMFHDGTAASCLERLTAHTDAGTCAMYQPRLTNGAVGHCSYYRWRPVLCRLFGFAAVRGRKGALSLAVCRHIRQNDPQSAEAAMALAEEAPCFPDYSVRIYGLDPALGNLLAPINIALRHAIQRLGLSFSYAHQESWRNNTAA